MKTFLLIALCLIKQLIMQNICNLSFFVCACFSSVAKNERFLSALFFNTGRGLCWDYVTLKPIGNVTAALQKVTGSMTYSSHPAFTLFKKKKILLYYFLIRTDSIHNNSQ